jgi:hypothetical protein
MRKKKKKMINTTRMKSVLLCVLCVCFFITVNEMKRQEKIVLVFLFDLFDKQIFTKNIYIKV